MTLIFPNKANVLIPYFCQVNTLRQFYAWTSYSVTLLFDLATCWWLRPFSLAIIATGIIGVSAELSVCRRNYRCVSWIIGVSAELSVCRCEKTVRIVDWICTRFSCAKFNVIVVSRCWRSKSFNCTRRILCNIFTLFRWNRSILCLHLLEFPQHQNAFI